MNYIIYFQPSDLTKFDFSRFQNSLTKYAPVPAEKTKEALKGLDIYERAHVSLLVKTGVALIGEFGGEEMARKYYDEHKQYFGEKFERLRRITGYLVGTLERWNDGKKAEESVRVKHSVNSCVDDLVRAARLQDEMLAANVAYAGKMSE
ncbi:hypothetical protein IKF81_03250 [Candidatus Saccharibacteria bacterium]|nr:hypothetical protein [Candidatus Saccharibacteria bacterium]